MKKIDPEFSELSRSQKAHLVILGLVFAKAKSGIQILTLSQNASAIFNLKDEDWTTISGLEIKYRSLFEQSIKEEWQRFENLWNESK
jgi:hypothetical protein